MIGTAFFLFGIPRDQIRLEWEKKKRYGWLFLCKSTIGLSGCQGKWVKFEKGNELWGTTLKFFEYFLVFNFEELSFI